MTKPFRALPLAVSLLASLAAAAPRPALAGAPDAAAPSGGAAPSVAYAYLADGRKVPLFEPTSAQIVVARLGSESVSIAELTGALNAMHSDRTADTKAKRIDARTILDRIVDLRLVAQEARTMGMAELPEYRATVAAYGDSVARNLLRGSVAATVKPDEAAVARRYQDAVREWKVASVAFEKEADAKAFAGRVKAGEPFEALAKQAVADKKAQGSPEPQWLPEKKMVKQVLAAVRKLPAGKASAPVAVEKRFAVLRQDGVRYPEDPAVRATVTEAVVAPVREKALRAYYATLTKKYATVDRALLGRIDLGAEKPGIAALMKDQRPLARIQGEAPITVGDLADAVARTLFHAPDRAASRRIMNDKKKLAFENLLEKRLFTKEARAQGVASSDAYRADVAQYEAQLLVGSYVQKVLIPSVRVTDDEVRKAYEARKAEFASPEMFKLEALAFTAEQAAREAHQKARSGTDFRWLAANASGQVPADRRSLEFDAVPLAVTNMPEGLAKALAGAKAGEFRVYTDSPKEHYLVHVLERYAPQVQPLEAVSAAVRGQLSTRKVDEAFKEAAGKLRQAEKVQILLTRIEL